MRLRLAFCFVGLAVLGGASAAARPDDHAARVVDYRISVSLNPGAR